MPDISAALCYLARDSISKMERPFKVLPAAGENFEQPLSNLRLGWHENNQITDLRANKFELKLERNRLEVLSHLTSYPVLDDIISCLKYLNEASDLLKEHFGTGKVVCFDYRVSDASREVEKNT